MTTYAVAREVPGWCDYLTAGKRYEVFSDGGQIFRLIDDESDQRSCPWSECYHLNGKDWHRIETDAEGWEDWKPSKNGEAPPDWQDGWEWQFFSRLGGTWANPADRKPIWHTDDTYRYRPRTVAEPAQVECDHPDADDYRNRAERAEQALQEAESRVRKLEALVCDQLLGGDV